MDRLSQMDATWLMFETERMPFHVGGLSLYGKPATSADAAFKVFRDHLAGLVATLPVLHRRLDPRALQFGNPVWVVDPAVDVDAHIRRVQVAVPGDDAAINALVAQLHQPLLDRSRPLWHVDWIDGLAGGGFGVFIKLHHAAADGSAVTQVMDAIFPSGKATAPARPPVLKEVPAPNALEMLWDVQVGALRGPLDFMERVPSMLRTGAANLRKEGGAATLARAARPSGAPRTPFNVALNADRSVGRVTLPLAGIKALGKARGGTINDAVVAICSRALRRHLEGRGQLPASRLVAGLPVSVREAGDDSLSNRVSMMTTVLPTDVEEAEPLMAAVLDATRESKELLDLYRPFSQWMATLPSVGVPGAQRLGELAEGLGWVNAMPVAVNLWISNVPGARQPFMCAGMPAKHNFPISIPMHGVALNITVTSYVENMEFGVIGATNALPDAQALADGLRSAYESLHASLVA